MQIQNSEGVSRMTAKGMQDTCQIVNSSKASTLSWRNKFGKVVNVNLGRKTINQSKNDEIEIDANTKW
jgi:hypothetical protein